MANKNKQGVAETFDASQSSEAFFSKNKKMILGAVAAVVLIVAGFFMYKSLVAGPREEKASTALAKGQEYFNQEQFDKALNGDGAGYVGFARIADDYSGTDAANLANLYAGLCNANLDKWEAAKKFLDAYSPASDAMVSPAAVAALGNAYAHLNDLDKAVDNQPTAKMPTVQTAAFHPCSLSKQAKFLSHKVRKKRLWPSTKTSRRNMLTPYSYRVRRLTSMWNVLQRNNGYRIT